MTHAKLPELGTGEIVATDGDRLAIRFASGERNFVCHLIEKHLSVTLEAPPPPPKAIRAAAKARAARAARAPKKAAAVEAVRASSDESSE